MLGSISIAERLHFAGPVPLSVGESLAFSISAGLLSVLLQNRQRLNESAVSLPNVNATGEAIRISMTILTLLVPASLLPGIHGFSLIILVALFILPILLALEKQLLLHVDRALRSRTFGVDCAIARDDADSVERTASTLIELSSVSLRSDRTTRCLNTWELVPSDRRQVERGRITNEVPGHRQARVLVLTAPCESKGTPPAPGSSRVDVEVPSDPVVRDWQPLNTPFRAPAPWRYEIPKRIVDIAISSFLLLLLGPMFLLITLVICLDSPGPVLFVQRRVGLNGRFFDICKFRSMYAGVPRYEFSPTSSRDRRITRVGRFLRRTSLDELPQLLNVLRGEMSLVGPRPEMPFIVKRYNAFQRQRLQVVPGITGLWQLSADRARQIHENLHYDLSYIRDRTICLDLAILIHTLFVAMRGI